MVESGLAVISEIDKTIANLANINTIPDARKILAIAQGYVITAHKLYKASEIKSINEANEDKGITLEMGRKAGELRLYAEARLGELIKQEQAAGRLATGGRPLNNPNNDVRVLKDYGLSWQDSSRAQELAEHKDIIAKIVVDSLDIPTRHAVLKEIKAKEHDGRNDINNIPEVPMGVYKTIVIDPPWPIQKITRDVRPNQVEIDYPTMSIENIKGILLPSNKQGCHIYLWTTQKHLPDAFDIFRAWEVNYQCLLTWVKNVGFTPYSWMYSTEHCLFGHIGNLPLLKLGVRLDFKANVREHSRKPDEFYDIVRQVSPGPRIDMFSREKRIGFEQYGNETSKFSANNI